MAMPTKGRTHGAAPAQADGSDPPIIHVRVDPARVPASSGGEVVATATIHDPCRPETRLADEPVVFTLSGDARLLRSDAVSDSTGKARAYMEPGETRSYQLVTVTTTEGGQGSAMFVQVPRRSVPAALGPGYWLASSDGAVFGAGGGCCLGSAVRVPSFHDVVAVAATPTGAGYWLAAADGGVFTFGDAGFHGSATGLSPGAPVVGMAPPPPGLGYWLVAADGGVVPFGDAGFHGSATDLSPSAPVVGVAPTATGLGYWLVAADGGVFTFGDAGFHGSATDRGGDAPVVGIAVTPTGWGYWLVTA